jgi:nicotinamide-nucleotide amidase
MPPDPEIFALAQQVGEQLRRQGHSLAVAESCTGGLLGGALTDVPGSSAYFLGGVISYADRVKMDQLQVPAATLRQYGAVSEQTAAAMATGVRQLLQADIGVSITGVAGPEAEGAKPVGLTFIGIDAPTLTTATHRFQWSGDRWDNRRRSVIAALELLVQTLGL